MLKSHYRDIFENQDTHWWYKGMESINKAFLDKYLPSKKGLKILDAGCGPGAALTYLSSYGDVIGIDISDEALKYAKKRGKVEKGDITKIQFKDKSFDVVVCLDVLYHFWVKEDMVAIRELHRILKKNGVLLLREPAFEWLRGNEDVVGYTRYRYSTNDVKEKLTHLNFKILKLSYVNFFLFPLVLLKRFPVVIGLKKESAISDIYRLNSFVNYFLSLFMYVEVFILKYIDLPYGSSAICVARKID